MPVKTDWRHEQGGHISTLNLRYTANGGSNSILLDRLPVHLDRRRACSSTVRAGDS